MLLQTDEHAMRKPHARIGTRKSVDAANAMAAPGLSWILVSAHKNILQVAYDEQNCLTSKGDGAAA